MNSICLGTSLYCNPCVLRWSRARVKLSFAKSWDTSRRKCRIIKRREIVQKNRANDSDFEDFVEVLGEDENIPGFDEMVLDDKFYEEIGEDREMLEKYPPWAPEATDPEGYNMTFEDFIDDRKDIPQYIKDDLKDAQYFGPPIILTAGFRAEELPMIRIMIDTIISKDVKLVPIKYPFFIKVFLEKIKCCRGPEMLSRRVEEILQFSETEWEKPRPDEDTRGGTWGSQRVLVFSGITMDLQAALVEVVEESGLPPVCVAIASELSKDKILGELLADAIRVQRDRKNPEKQLWDIEGRTVDDVSDLKSYMDEKVVERVETVEEGLKTGKAKFQKQKDGTLKVDMDGLEESVFDPEDFTDAKRRMKRKPQNSQNQGKIGKKVEDSDPQNDKLLHDDMVGSLFTDEDQKLDVSDYFAVDNLVDDARGEIKQQEEGRRQEEAQAPSSSTSEETTDTSKKEKDEGNIYHLSTPPVEIEKNVKHSTVFNGLVSDSGKFLKENFGYSTKKKDDAFGNRKAASASNDLEMEVVDINTTEEQDAFNARSIGYDKGPEEDGSVEDVIQEALNQGMDPEYLKQLIRSASGLSAESITPRTVQSKRPQFTRPIRFNNQSNKEQ